jgi:L-ascorbate metabolism protein UlaG (beta-lactamase superfamily)
MIFTYYGHACFSLKLNHTVFLFDPFISGNELAAHIDIQSIKADYILISHGHGDHLADAVILAQQTGAKVISNFEIITWLQEKGLANVHPMNFGSKDFEFGTLTYFQAMHSSCLPDGANGGNPGGFILGSPYGNFYYSGDTSLMLDMQLVPHYAKIDVAIMPIGGNFTMNAKDAVKASDFIQCNNIVGVHFDTFGYIKIDHEKTKQLFADAGKKLLLPEIGKSYEV